MNRRMNERPSDVMLNLPYLYGAIQEGWRIWLSWQYASMTRIQYDDQRHSGVGCLPSTQHRQS